MPVTFVTPDNFRTESITFDVANTPLPYNGILGHPALSKFMAASHYAYNVLKMPAEWGVITIKGSKEDAIFCVEQTFRATVASPGNADKPSASNPSPSRKRLHWEDSEMSREMPLHDERSHPVTIGAVLSEK